MKEIEAWQEAGLGSEDEDPFNKVLKKEEHPGRLRLHGRGFMVRSLKGNIDAPTPLGLEFIEAIRASLGDEMQKDFDAHKEQMEGGLQVEKDKVTQMQMKVDAQKVELDAQKVELDAQKVKVATNNSMLALLQNFRTREMVDHVTKASTQRG